LKLESNSGNWPTVNPAQRALAGQTDSIVAKIVPLCRTAGGNTM